MTSPTSVGNPTRIKGINIPRTLYSRWESGSATYLATLKGDSWVVYREGSTANWLPSFREEETAREVLDYLVQNDASVDIAIHWFKQGNIEPMLRLLEQIILISRRFDAQT